MQFFLPESVKAVLSTLKNSGFEAYIVGGSVRNYLLGILPDDFDICTSARPEQILNLFDKTVNTGIKHGTVTVISDGKPFEVTTFRTDGAYKDFRHPDNVRFTESLKEDLSRRDFTVNAMCYSDDTGIIDYFGGLDDLKNRTLKAVGVADLRFKEDALRILRLFRFASTLGFDIESETYNAAIENAMLLSNISAERIRAELLRLSLGSCPEVITPLIRTGCIPFLRTGEISKIPLLPEKSQLKFFAFLSATSENLETTLNSLKCSNSFSSYAKRLQADINTECKTRADIKRILRRLENDIFDLFYYKSAISGIDITEQINIAEQILESDEPYKISQLCVDGKDLQNNGYRGKEIGDKLEYLLECIIENPSLNTKGKLLKLI